MEEVAFWAALTGGPGHEPGILADLGAGPSSLAVRLPWRRSVALDLSGRLLACSPVPWRVRCDAGALPLQPGAAGAVLSRLFGIAYAAGADPHTRLPRLAAEVARVLRPGGVAALELPLNTRPRRMQWISESAEVGAGLTYRFQYLDLAADHELGAALNTEIVVEGAARRWKLQAPLFVFTPEGARQWARQAGMSALRFFASYDLTTETAAPPEDALRGILCGCR